MSESIHVLIEKEKTRQKAENAMRDLINSTNIMGMDDEIVEGMLKGILSSHRTLQQSFMRVFYEMMKEYANVNYDLRNESAVEFAKKVSEIDHYFPYV